MSTPSDPTPAGPTTYSVMVAQRRRFSTRWLRDYAVIATLLVLFVALLVSSASFRTPGNLANILNQGAVVGIMATGVAVVFIAGEFDLSIGSIFALSALVGASAVQSFGGVAGLLIGVLTGAAIGMINGLLVSIVRINAFMATLATSFLIAGVAVIWTRGAPVRVTDESYLFIGQFTLGGVLFPVYVWVAVILLLTVLLRLTKFGRRVYAVGGNKEAARLSGVNVSLVKTLAFVISGATAALAGNIAAAQVGAANPNAGATLVLPTIAAVVVGGISIYGGEGAIWRSAAGILLLVLINNGFNLLGIDALFAQIVQGAVILVAVGVDAWTGKARR